MRPFSNRFVGLEAVLMCAKMAVPLCSQVVVERVRGPGYTATANEVMWSTVVALMLLGLLSLWNLRRAMSSILEKSS